MASPPRRYPTLSQRRQELTRLNIPGMSFENRSGRELWCHFTLAPGEFSRFYGCSMRLRKGYLSPQVIVRTPNLDELAGGKKLPHTYRHSGKGTMLCLCLPGGVEWKANMALGDTFLPWTLEWLWYFEDWLTTGKWLGGGKMHGAGQNE